MTGEKENEYNREIDRERVCEGEKEESNTATDFSLSRALSLCLYGSGSSVVRDWDWVGGSSVIE